MVSVQSAHSSQLAADCAVLIAVLGICFGTQCLLAVRFTAGATWIIAIAFTLFFTCSAVLAPTESPLDIKATERIVRGLSMYFVLALSTTTLYGKHQVMVAGAAFATSFALGFARRNANSDLMNPTLQSGLLTWIVKRSVDILISAFILVLLVPLFLVVSIFIIADSGLPVFFRHDRAGTDGHLFAMWKFRSMHVDAPRYQSSPLSDSDPRLTRIGRVLRRFSIDELPQLINVFRGEMSLVGPRPEMPFIVQQYSANERRRLTAQPGITGLWQISPARAFPIHEHVEYDLYYISHQNMFLDIAIMVRTVTAVFRGIGAA
jgi:lipopolysaccharide/colanic/teichoic acid biosynthesis glycosyltransferase